jgi:HD-GYP domain-containing protein (c-di-GMP phosphodiesterase class II)
MPETGVEGALQVSERLRTAAEQTTVPGVGAVTISLGIAVFPDHADVRDTLVEAADQALYVAKHEGKNQSVLAGSDVPSESRRTMVRAEPLAQSMLQALRGRSEGAAAHSELVADMCVALCEHMGMSDHDTQILRTAAFLHDVGRLTLPDSVLNSTGALSEGDWNLIRSHPQAAYDMLSGAFESDITRIVLTHLEHLDGSGYPNGISGEDIPLPSRMLLVADAFDAMTSHRLYRGPLSLDVALLELQAEAGIQLDPNVVEAFVSMIRARDNVVDLGSRRAV